MKEDEWMEDNGKQEERKEEDEGELKKVGRREISPGVFCQDKDLIFRYRGDRGKLGKKGEK